LREVVHAASSGDPAADDDCSVVVGHRAILYFM
jgi:hypothetical protein